MKIGVNSRVYQNSETGIPYFIKCLYVTLIKKHREIEYVFFQTNTKKVLGITRTHLVPNTGLGSFLFDGLFVNRLAFQEGVAIFHGPSNVLPLFKRKGIKYIVTIHDLSFLIFPDQYSKIFNIYYRFVIKRTLKNADMVVADSCNTKNDIQKFYKTPEDKIKVIHLGVNEKYLNVGKTPRLIQEKYFFSITTHPKRKNILGVLDAIACASKLQEYKYVIAGLIPDEQLQELKERIRALRLEEHVILFGYASEEQLISLYQNAEFFVYPSFYEGFGFPVLEAMALSCPVIVSNTSSLTEIVPHQEWSVNPNNTEEIAEKMTSLLELSLEQRESLVQNNLSFSKNFSWEKTAQKYHEIFTSIKQKSF